MYFTGTIESTCDPDTSGILEEGKQNVEANITPDMYGNISRRTQAMPLGRSVRGAL